MGSTGKQNGPNIFNIDTDNYEPKNAAVVEVSDEPSGEGAPEHVGEDELSNDAVDEPELLDA